MTNASGFLPYGRQTIDDDDIAVVTAALKDDFLTAGPRVEAYEHDFAIAVSSRNAVACSTGTAALHIAAQGIGLGQGDVSIVPAITFLATANASRYCEAEVAFCDVDPETGLATAETVEAALPRAAKLGRPRAVFPVHLNGQTVDVAAVAAATQRHSLAIVEDACHSLGAPGIGSTPHSRAAIFSTHPVKAIATAEGGVATTADADLARRMRMIRAHGIERDPARLRNRDLAFGPDGEPNPWYHEMPEIGWGYRLPDLLCALGQSQLRKLEGFYRRRCEIAALYDELLRPLAPALRPITRRAGSLHGWHLYAVLIDFDALKTHRAAVMRALRAKGIGTQVHYIPLYWQPYYRDRYGEISLPGAEAYYRRCLSLPIFPMMSDADVEWTVAALRSTLFG